jgi:hypothetical protein
MTFHYSIPELDAYLNNDMSWLKSWACKFHLSRCEECRKKLDEVLEQSDLIAFFRNFGNNEPKE